MYDAHVRAREGLIAGARKDLFYMSPEAYIRFVDGWPMAVEPWWVELRAPRPSLPPEGFFEELKKRLPTQG